MFKIAYNTNGLRTISLLDSVRAIAAAGYQGIELSLHPKHIDPCTFTEANANVLSKCIQDEGITACCLATGADNLLGPERFEPSLIHPTPSGRQQRIDLIRRAVDIACGLEVPVVSIASGFRRPEVTPELARDLICQGVSQCLEHSGTSVVLAIEPEPGFFVQTNPDAVDLIREIGSPYFRLNQDIGHANVSEDDYLGSIGRSMSVTSHVHVEDIKGRHHYHEIPGDGDIDFQAFFRVLRDQAYEGFISVELYNHGDMYAAAMSRSLDFLRAAEAALCPAA